MDINKLKLPDDWAKDYESPVTLKIRKIAQQIEEQRENQIMAVVNEQMGVNVDKGELTRALAYDRDQYRRGYEAGWKARSEDVPQWIPVSERLPEDRNLVLVTAYWHETYQVMQASFFGEGEKNGWWCVPFNNCGEHMRNDLPVIAWRPLPEPYREEGAE